MSAEKKLKFSHFLEALYVSLCDHSDFSLRLPVRSEIFLRRAVRDYSYERRDGHEP